MRRKKWDYFCETDFDWLLTKPGTYTFLLIQVLIGSFQKNWSHKIRLKKLPENPSPVPSLQRAGCDIVRWGTLEYHIKPFFAQRCINPFIKSPLKMESSYNTLCRIKAERKNEDKCCVGPQFLLFGGAYRSCAHISFNCPFLGLEFILIFLNCPFLIQVDVGHIMSCIRLHRNILSLSIE